MTAMDLMLSLPKRPCVIHVLSPGMAATAISATMVVEVFSRRETAWLKQWDLGFCKGGVVDNPTIHGEDSVEVLAEMTSGVLQAVVTQEDTPATIIVIQGVIRLGAVGLTTQGQISQMSLVSTVAMAE